MRLAEVFIGRPLQEQEKENKALTLEMYLRQGDFGDVAKAHWQRLGRNSLSGDSHYLDSSRHWTPKALARHHLGHSDMESTMRRVINRVGVVVGRDSLTPNPRRR